MARLESVMEKYAMQQISFVNLTRKIGFYFYMANLNKKLTLCGVCGKLLNA
jgi:hypothetical protein